DENYARVASETLDYVLREMQDDDGGFYATQDADSEGEEGRFYVWRLDELRAVLDPAGADLVARHYGVTAEGNFEGGATVLHIARSVEELAVESGLSEAQVRGRLAAARRRLLDERR